MGMFRDPCYEVGRFKGKGHVIIFKLSVTDRSSGEKIKLNHTHINLFW